MKKWAKNPWVLGIGTTVIGGVLLSLLLDWIQGIDWLSTFKNVMRFIFNGVVSFLNFEIKVWWLLIAIAIIVVGLFVVAKISGSQSNNIPPHFYNTPRITCWVIHGSGFIPKCMMGNTPLATCIQFAQNVVYVSNKVARMDWR